ncbi:CvfB family protein [Salinicola halimionae]|uniref:CvfB family protein n=1 Tax=Salinicola halimionae TaxID=1949081 RepID=UPI000DA12C3E|nr:S1-like domain-containing RNA-binding protein [Salinicola halimionae]
MTRPPRDNAPVESPRAAEPQVNVGDVAYLRVTKVTDIGAFLNWGRPKDLLLPFGEQRFRPDAGKRVLVMIYVDDRMRPVASMKIDKFLQDESEGLKAGDRVSLTIADLTDLGAKAVVNSRFWGLLYHDDMSRPLRRGDRMDGYVRRVRDDARLDLSLLPPGQARLDVVGDKVLAALSANDGFLALGDKSSADAIKARLGVSKNAFKQAIGRLYKQRRIVIEDAGIRLIEGD